jgi:apolipoprotein N-acyltransferase
MKLQLIVGLALVSAISTLLSTAPFGFGIAAIVAPAALIYIACHTNTKDSKWFVFAFQFPLWLWLEHWVMDVSVAGWIGLSVYMSIWAPLFVVLLRRVTTTLCLSKISIVLTAPTLWVGLECMRGIVIFDGYPWYLAGTGLIDWPNAQIAAIGGVWLVSFAVVSWASGIATYRQLNRKTLVLLILSLIGSALYGGYVKKGPIPTRLPMALIQTNVPQSNKIAWTNEQQEADVEAAVHLTKIAAGKKTTLGQFPRLIVWPETMLPGSGFELSGIDFAPYTASAQSLWQFPEKLRRLAYELQIPLLIGSHTWIGVTIEDEDKEWLKFTSDKEFNSAVLVHPDGTTSRYDKSFLTPFGERIPYVSMWPALEKFIRDFVGTPMLFSLDAGDLQSNIVVEGVRIATPICFEDTVPSVIRNLVWKNNIRKTDVLINISNDGWFGNMDAARLQHVREARVRCIENRTPMVRVANTGQSCLITSRGVIQTIAMNNGHPALRESAILLVSPVMGWERPWSVFVGNAIAWLSLIGGILLIACTFQPRSTHHET